MCKRCIIQILIQFGNRLIGIEPGAGSPFPEKPLPSLAMVGQIGIK